MRTKPWGSRCNRKWRKNSSTDRGSNFCSLLCAESRQRNVTSLPSGRDQGVDGDGHAMGVTAQIAENMLWASERTFRVGHPVLSEQWSQPRSKGFRLSEELPASMKVELAIMKGALERLVEL